MNECIADQDMEDEDMVDVIIDWAQFAKKGRTLALYVPQLLFTMGGGCVGGACGTCKIFSEYNWIRPFVFKSYSGNSLFKK